MNTGVRSYEELADEFELHELAAWPNYAIHFTPFQPGRVRLKVRRFTGPRSRRMNLRYVDLVAQLSRRIDHAPEIDLVDVDRPVEVGLDFVAWTEHGYRTSTRSYVRGGTPPKPPPQLATMRDQVRRHLERTRSTEPEPVSELLEKTLAQPCGQLYWVHTNQKFLLTHPHIPVETLVE